MTRKVRMFALILGLALVATFAGTILIPRDPMDEFIWRGGNPRPVVITIGTNRGPTRVFPGFFGCFIIPPDGTLWRWGQPGGFNFSRTLLPEQVTTNSGWAQAIGANQNCVAVGADGSLWTWGFDFAAPLFSSTPVSNWIPAPKRVGIEHDWVCATSGGGHALALKQDGTIWGWGHDSEGQLGNGLGPEQTNLVLHRWPHICRDWVQVGTNRSWTALSAEGPCTLAMRADGTLWVWGHIGRLLDGKPGGILSVPTQVCRETNWVAFQWTYPGVLALNCEGELWSLFRSSPQASASVATVGELFTSNCVPGRFAMGYGFCQLHPDGTLWETKLDVSQNYLRPLNQWHRKGKRSDWIALWSGTGIVYGMTADGTIWTWGEDFGREGITPHSLKMHLWENRVRGWLGMPLGPYNPGGVTPILREPRPLMKIVGRS